MPFLFLQLWARKLHTHTWNLGKVSCQKQEHRKPTFGKMKLRGENWRELKRGRGEEKKTRRKEKRKGEAERRTQLPAKCTLSLLVAFFLLLSVCLSFPGSLYAWEREEEGVNQNESHLMVFHVFEHISNEDQGLDTSITMGSILKDIKS